MGMDIITYTIYLPSLKRTFSPLKAMMGLEDDSFQILGANGQFWVRRSVSLKVGYTYLCAGVETQNYFPLLSIELGDKLIKQVGDSYTTQSYNFFPGYSFLYT